VGPGFKPDPAKQGARRKERPEFPAWRRRGLRPSSPAPPAAQRRHASRRRRRRRSNGERPCAMRPPITPASTSPEPAVARKGEALVVDHGVAVPARR